MRSARPMLMGSRPTCAVTGLQPQHHVRKLDRLSRKIGTMNLTRSRSPVGRSPIRKHSAHTGVARAMPAEATQPIKPFQRKPAHIKVIEDCKKPPLRPTIPTARQHVSAISVQEAVETVSRAQRSCDEVRKQLSELAARTDFNLLDRIVAHRGEESLESLRHAFDELNCLASVFSKILFVPSNGLTRAGSLGSTEGSKSNCIQIKSVVVSLRAISEKLDQQPMGIDNALKVVRLVDQGLSEQILSWAGECESAYDVLLPERRNMSKTVAVEHAKTSERTCGASIRSRRQYITHPRREVCAERPVSDPPSGAGVERRPSPPVEARPNLQHAQHPSPPQPVYTAEDDNVLCVAFTYSASPRACKTKAERKERLQRYRPPMLIIPPV